MAGTALCSELPGVSIILEMACGTIHGRAFEQIILMTICTGCCRMLSIKMECERGMIHLCRFPSIGSVTGTALSPKLTLMRIILGVTGTAVLRRAFENAVDMALLARHC
jgi:hypothetical protein